MPPTLAQISGLFANPALVAAGAAAVSIPIAIHILTRLRRRQEPWAAMRFLMQAFRKHRQRLRFEQLLLLLVRCLMLVLLALALGQPLLGQWGGGAQSRLVCIVLDDALSTQADEGGRARFERLRETALGVIDDMNRGDHLALWRAATPGEQTIAPALLDPAAARQVIESIKPRFSSSDLSATLEQVARTIGDPDTVDPDRPVAVVVLSDFGVATIDLDQPAPRAIEQLRERARLLALPPAEQVHNVQIARVAPRRSVMVIDTPASLTVPIELQLRRFVADSPSATTDAVVRLWRDDDDKPLGESRQQHHWAAGQSMATINLDVPIEPDDVARAAGRVLTVEARIQNSGITDALAADDVRWNVVELRERLAVALVDDPQTLAAAERDNLRPRDWLQLALAPRSDPTDVVRAQPDPIEIVQVSVDTLSAEQLTTIDAAIVLRPDRLTQPGIAALRQFAARGGLVWLVAPDADVPPTWATPLCEQFDLDWRVAVETRNVADESPPWTLRQTASPEALNLLGADWDALLRPVMVRRALELSIDAGGADAVWLETSERLPLLAHAPVGEGAVLMLTVAIDSDWSNLPTKPLFVPLLHETLRSAVGRSQQVDALCGQSPLLSHHWAAAQRLVRPDGAQVALKAVGTGAEPARPLLEPGIYRPSPSIGGRKLAVNIDPAAADTRAAAEQAVMAWLGAEPFDLRQAAAALNVQTDRTNIGWPLLWAALAMVLLETALARWFSHATRDKGQSWVAQTGRAAV